MWVFSANTVENIPKFYEQFGPGPIDRAVPEWALARPVGEIALWEWGALALVILLCAGIGWLVGFFSERVLARFEGAFRTLSGKLIAPVAFSVAFGLLFGVTGGGLLFSGSILSFLQPISWISLYRRVDLVGDARNLAHHAPLRRAADEPLRGG